MSWSVCLSVWKVYCGKTANWIQIDVVSGGGQGMGVLDGVHVPQAEEEV